MRGARRAGYTRPRAARQAPRSARRCFERRRRAPGAAGVGVTVLRGSRRGAPWRLGAGTLSVAMRRHATADAHSPALPAPARQRSSSSSVSSSSMVPMMAASQDRCGPTKRRGGSSLPAAPACAAAGDAAVPVSAWRAGLVRSHRAGSRVGIDATKNAVFDRLLAPARSGQGGDKISTLPRSAPATAGRILAHCSLNLVSVRWHAAHGQRCSGRSWRGQRARRQRWWLERLAMLSD